MKITRVYTTDDTMGILTIPDHFFVTLEMPWRGNERGRSCIPEGKYRWRKHISPTFGQCVQILDVPERSEILIRPLNFAADTRGHVGIGHDFQFTLDIRMTGEDEGVGTTGSREAMAELLAALPDMGDIEITSATGEPEEGDL